jgi:hypothetical protein
MSRAVMQKLTAQDDIIHAPCTPYPFILHFSVPPPIFVPACCADDSKQKTTQCESHKVVQLKAVGPYLAHHGQPHLILRYCPWARMNRTLLQNRPNLVLVSVYRSPSPISDIPDTSSSTSSTVNFLRPNMTAGERLVL